MFDERRHVRVFLGRDDFLQFNSTWEAQIDHQDGGDVLEIIGSLLSIANIAVYESRGNSHGCCLSIMLKCVFYIIVVCIRYVCVCVCVVYVCGISPRTRILIDIDGTARDEKSRTLTEIYLHNLVVSTIRRFRQLMWRVHECMFSACTCIYERWF